MSDRQPKRNRVRSEDVTDLFRILRNMCRDPEMTDANFRLAFRVAQCVDAGTGWAEAGHEFLIDEVPRTDKAKVRRFRRVMGELGWLRSIQGERGRATRYLFLDGRCEAIEAAADEARDRRHAEAALRKIERDTALKAAAIGGGITPLNGETVDPITGEISPLNHGLKGVKSSPDKGVPDTPTLPHSSTSPEGCRLQDWTQGGRTPQQPSCSCGAAPIVRVRWQQSGEVGPWHPLCQECDEDWLPYPFEERETLVAGE